MVKRYAFCLAVWFLLVATVALLLMLAVPCGAYAQRSNKPTPQSRTIEGTVVETTGTVRWQAIVIESGGRKYYVQTEFIPEESERNPTVVGDIYSDGARVRVTYYGTSRVYFHGPLLALSATRIVGLVSRTVAPPAPKVQVFGPGLSIDLGNDVKLEFVLINGGSFQMGSVDDGYPVHRVTITQPFYLGKYEVTQAQWKAVMETTVAQQRDKTNRGFRVLNGEGGNYPMYFVNWDEAQEFIKRLNGLNNSFTYRLPTEAEWEYAARAGTSGPRAGNLDAMAWYLANSGEKTHPVGQKQPNVWGLYDMYGNVWELVQDEHETNSASPVVAPVDPDDRWSRGGSFYSHADSVSSTIRKPTSDFRNDPGSGFRVVAVARTP